MKLDIDLSNVPDEEAGYIRRVIEASNGKTLAFDRDCLTDAGAIAVAEALPGCKLENLFVLGIISDVGVKAIAEALPASNLSVLNLCFNRITDVGGLALLRAIPRSKSIFACFAGCGVSNSVQHAIETAMYVRPRRDKLFLLLRLMAFWRSDGDNAMLNRVADFLLS